MWFPAHWGLFGDWFGHRLAPLFGNGIRDISLAGNKSLSGFPPKSRFIPGYAHALYLKFPDDNNLDSVTTQLRTAIDFKAARWIP